MGLLRTLPVLAGLLLAGPAPGALFTIPEDAAKVRLSMPGNGYAVIGDKQLRIAPSAQFRDPQNRIVMPASLRGAYSARVILDPQGQVWRAWLLGRPADPPLHPDGPD